MEIWSQGPMTKHVKPAQPSAALVVLAWTLTFALTLAGCGRNPVYLRFSPPRAVDGGSADEEQFPSADAEDAGAGGLVGKVDSGEAGATGGGGNGMAAGGQRGGGGGATSGGGSGASPSGSGGATATGGTGPSTGPRIISVDFSGTETPMTASEVAGYKPASHWNNAPAASGTMSTVMDQMGVATGSSATWSAGSGGVFRLSWTDAPGNSRMMNGYLDPYASTGPASVTVTNLPAAFGAARYDVYLYAYGPLDGGNRASKYTVGSTTSTLWQAAPSASAFGGFLVAPDGGSGNVIVFRGLTGTSFTVTATPDAANGTNTRAPLNGLQIVSPSGT
jgi:hypothetical protein